jgi:hypothetical protein
MGLAIAPIQFQRLVDLVVAGLLWHNCPVNLDDIIVYLVTFGQHLGRLALVFDRLVKANLKLKPTNCHLFRDKVYFLGLVIS